MTTEELYDKLKLIQNEMQNTEFGIEISGQDVKTII